MQAPLRDDRKPATVTANPIMWRKGLVPLLCSWCSPVANYNVLPALLT